MLSLVPTTRSPSTLMSGFVRKIPSKSATLNLLSSCSNLNLHPKLLFLRLKVMQGLEILLLKNYESFGPLKLFSEHLDLDFTWVELLAFFIINFIEYFKRRLVFFCDWFFACVKIIFNFFSFDVEVDHQRIKFFFGFSDEILRQLSFLLVQQTDVLEWMFHVLVMDSFLNTLLTKVLGALNAIKLELFIVVFAVTQGVDFIDGFKLVSGHQFGFMVLIAARVTKE